MNVSYPLVGPDQGGLREFARLPDLPFDPLPARRRGDVDEYAK